MRPSWGFARSQSGGGESDVPSRNGTSSTSTLRASPPDELPPTIVEDVPSPLTPPKKLWERQYRHFLKGNHKKDSPVDTKKQQHKRTTSSSSSSREKSNEGSVRGGNLFSNIFHHHSSTSPSPSTTSRRVKSLGETTTSTTTLDELDGTLRRGVEKACYSSSSSPGNHRRTTKSLSTNTVTMPSQSEGGGVFLRPQHDPYAVHSKFMTTTTTPSSSSLDGSAMKKAFTEFHNLADHDNAAPYLGDDNSTSFRGQQGLFWAQHHKNNDHQAITKKVVSHGSLRLQQQHTLSPFLDTVQENVAIHPERRILKPIQGVDVWQSDRRYLIAPAVLAACPLAVLKTLSGTSLPPNNNDNNKCATTNNNNPFGTIVLGECLLTYAMGGQTHAATAQRWSSAVLALRQNYLLEYNVKSQQEMPRGYAHLQFAVCHDGDFQDALELHFYASPCAKSDKRVLMIRLKDMTQRQAWRTSLNRAANLNIHDLYDYNESKPIGQGLYASVYAAQRRTTSSDHVALKIFDKNHFWRLVVKGRERSDTLVREASVQATLTAKCGKVTSFVRIRGFFETSDHVVLELELLDGADLFQYISSKNVLSEPKAAHILRDILQALEAMNRIGLAHRDIKPANVLMCQNKSDGEQRQLVKVCDFGMATFVDVDGHVRGRCGTPGYVAPEIFTAGVHGGYGNKVDVFSAGVTLYVMLCGYEPFYGETDAELVDANRKSVIEFPAQDWNGVSHLARDLVQQMLEPDPKKRPDAKTCLKHPWLDRHNKFDAQPLDASLSLPLKEAPAEAACVIS